MNAAASSTIKGFYYQFNKTLFELLDAIEVFESNKPNIRVGKYISIEEGNFNHILAVIQSIKTSRNEATNETGYIITTQPIGSYTINEDDSLCFKQGGVNLPSPTEIVSIPDEQIVNKIFSRDSGCSYYVGKLINNDSVKYYIDGNKFFSKHIAVVGSTGSGKSYAVSKLLQEAIGIKAGENVNAGVLKNSHVIIFDIHSEYGSAFKLEKDFNVNILNVEKLNLPYWLMNSEELESLFIESNESNSHNQMSQFKKAVVLSKEKHNPEYTKITYDMPVYFDINEVYNYIQNLNNEVVNKKDGEQFLPKLSDGTLLVLPPYFGPLTMLVIDRFGYRNPLSA